MFHFLSARTSQVLLPYVSWLQSSPTLSQPAGVSATSHPRDPIKLSVRFQTLPGFQVVVVFEIHMRDTASMMYADRPTVVLHHLSEGVPAFR